MKKYFQQKTVMVFAIMAMLTNILSFKGKAGGDVYEIYLNDKLVCKESYKLLNGSKELHLGNLNAKDRLVIKYSHCGEIGKNRTIVIKDAKNNVLKEWKFTDAEGNKAVMVIPVKELLALKSKNPSLQLFYSASQMPAGKMLASIKLNEKKTAMLTPKVKQLSR
jgi:hypothetical protein